MSEAEEQANQQRLRQGANLLAQVVKNLGMRGGVLILVQPDGSLITCGNGGDAGASQGLQVLKNKLDPIILEATCIIQGMMPCTKCGGQGKIAAGKLQVACLGCFGEGFVPRPGIREILTAPEGATP